MTLDFTPQESIAVHMNCSRLDGSCRPAADGPGLWWWEPALVPVSRWRTTMTTKSEAAPAKAAAPRPHTKAERLLDLLRTGTGATLEDMTEATGWQAHTVRAAMTGLRKRGIAITRHVEGTTTVWSAAAGDAQVSA